MSLFGGGGNNQQQGSGFGGFGSSNTNTGGFGQSTSGAGFGGATTGTAGGFGGFGSGTSGTSGFGSNNNNNNTTSLFGQPQNKPAFGASTSGGGGGLFGAASSTTGNTGGFGGFGSNTNSQSGGGLFGNTANTASKPAFGSGTTGGGLFGGSNTGFGSTSNQSTNQPTSAFGSTPFGQGNATCEGTGSTPFSAYTEKEGASNTTNHFQSISFMAPYKNWSFEELRLADYNHGRRFGNGSGQPGAFGSTNFGGFGQPNNTAGGFGQTATTSSGGMFGSGTQTASPFGTQQQQSTGFGSSNTGGGLFGQPKPASTGLFGNTTSSTTSGGLFGTANNTNNSSGGGFGSSGGTGLFGQQNNQQQNKGLFGNTSTTGGGFGSSTGFGSNTNAGGTGFGTGTQNNSNPFGQPSNTQQSNPFGGFGQPNQTQNQSQTQTGTSNPFGGFGQQNQEQKPAGLFGNTSTNTNTTGGGLFSTQNSAQSGGGLFGQPNNNQSGGSSLFGQKPAAGNSLFGQPNTNNTNTGSNLFSGFGNQNQNQQPQSQGSGLFSGNNANQQKPGGLFSNTNSGTGTGLFGNSNSTNNQPTSGGLFNTNNQQQQQPSGGGGLFGNTTNNNSGSSLFGGSQQQQQQQQQQPPPANQFQSAPTLFASITDPNAFGSPSIFSGLPPPPQVSGPIATPISQKPKQKKNALLPYYKLTPNGAASRLQTPSKHGYGFSYSTYGTPGSASSNASTPGGLGGSLLYSSVGRGLGKSLSTSNLRGNYGDADSILSPGAFSANSSRYGGTGSMKKLTIDRSLRTDLFGDRGNSALASPEKDRQAGILKKKVSFDASTVGGNGEQSNGVQVSGTGNAEQSSSAGPSTEGQGFPRTPRSQNRSKPNAGPSQPEMEQVRGNELAVVPEDDSPDAASAPQQRASVPKTQEDQEPGDYWMKPTKEQIEKMTKEQRREISGFVVGRHGCGKVEFNKPVDLSNIKLNDICGNIVVIIIRSLTVYPETTKKPPMGKGLNVPSTLYLENSWPRQRDRLLPRYEKSGHHFTKHIERLRRIGGTVFVRYEKDTGTWVFTVPHFTTYGFEYDDDDEPNDGDSLHLNDSILTEPPETPTPKYRGANGPTPKIQNTTQGTNSTPHSTIQSENLFAASEARFPPGAFDATIATDAVHGDSEMEELHEEEPFLDERSAGSLSDSGEDEPSDLEKNDEETNGQAMVVREDDEDIDMAGAYPEQDEDDANLTATKPVLDVSGDWTEDLLRTIRPRQQDRQALRARQTTLAKKNNAEEKLIAKDGFPAITTSIDLMNSLFGLSSSRKGKDVGGQAGVKSLSSNAHQRPDLTDNTQGSDRERLGLVSKMNAEYPLRAEPPTNLSYNTLKHHRTRTTFSLDRKIPTAMLQQTPFSDFREAVQPDSTQERSVWELASILFDDQDSTLYGVPTSEKGKYDARIRKDRVIRFWRQLCEDDAEKAIKEAGNEEERAIAFLSTNKVEEACEALLRSKNYRLATLIAQIGGNATLHEEMTSQITAWRDLNVLSEMSEPIRTLYSLLAGITCTCEGKKAQHVEDKASTFSISERFNLDWKRAFGLRLFYAIKTNDPIEAAVKAFIKDIETVEPKKPDDDILFSLLQIYSTSKKWLPFPSLVHTLLPKTTSQPTVSARLSFHLYTALTSRFPNTADPTVADTINTQFAVQLDSSGEWLWALFALIHINDPAERERRIKALLAYHAGDLNADPPHDSKWRDLVDNYKIPESWLYQAKALRARTVDGDRLREADYLVKAQQWLEAHEVLKRVVGPECVIAEEWPQLRGLLDAFRKSKEGISDWGLGGEVYSNYVAVVTDAIEGRRTKENVLKQLEDTLRSLQVNVDKARKEGEGNQKEIFREMVALQEMMSVVEREKAIMKERGHEGG